MPEYTKDDPASGFLGFSVVLARRNATAGNLQATRHISKAVRNATATRGTFNSRKFIRVSFLITAHAIRALQFAQIE
jgi:hypothetical protein